MAKTGRGWDAAFLAVSTLFGIGTMTSDNPARETVTDAVFSAVESGVRVATNLSEDMLSSRTLRFLVESYINGDKDSVNSALSTTEKEITNSFVGANEQSIVYFNILSVEQNDDGPYLLLSGDRKLQVTDDPNLTAAQLFKSMNGGCYSVGLPFAFKGKPVFNRGVVEDSKDIVIDNTGEHLNKAVCGVARRIGNENGYVTLEIVDNTGYMYNVITPPNYIIDFENGNKLYVSKRVLRNGLIEASGVKLRNDSVYLD